MYTLAIEDIVEVPVKFTLKVGKVNKPFAFTLIAKRLDADEMQSRMLDCELKFKDFLKYTDLVTGWVDQRLVLDGNGQPAEFSADAFAEMLKAPGVARVCFDAYQKEVGAKEKN